jgi:hypothetical protein
MNIITIIALVCLAGLGYFWLRKPGLKGIKARTMVASRNKPDAKPRLP